MYDCKNLFARSAATTLLWLLLLLLVSTKAEESSILEGATIVNKSDLDLNH